MIMENAGQKKAVQQWQHNVRDRLTATSALYIRLLLPAACLHLCIPIPKVHELQGPGSEVRG